MTAKLAALVGLMRERLAGANLTPAIKNHPGALEFMELIGGSASGVVKFGESAVAPLDWFIGFAEAVAAAGAPPLTPTGVSADIPASPFSFDEGESWDAKAKKFMEKNPGVTYAVALSKTSTRPKIG